MANEGSEREEERLLSAEIIRLKKESTVLERQWSTKYRLAVFVVLAIPVYFVAGPFWAGIAILMTPALVATQAYLLMVRRAEVRELLAEAKHAVSAYEPPLGPSAVLAPADAAPAAPVRALGPEAGA